MQGPNLEGSICRAIAGFVAATAAVDAAGQSNDRAPRATPAPWPGLAGEELTCVTGEGILIINETCIVEPFLTMPTNNGLKQVVPSYVDGAYGRPEVKDITCNRYAAQDLELAGGHPSTLERSLLYAEDRPDRIRRVPSDYTQTDPVVVNPLQLPRWLIEGGGESGRSLTELTVHDLLIVQASELKALVP